MLKKRRKNSRWKIIRSKKGKPKKLSKSQMKKKNKKRQKMLNLKEKPRFRLTWATTKLPSKASKADYSEHNNHLFILPI